MRLHHAIAPILIALSSGCGLTPEEQAVADEILVSEPQKKWTEIAWASGVDQALARAKAEQKPIMVFFAVNEGGQAGAEKT